MIAFRLRRQHQYLCDACGETAKVRLAVGLGTQVQLCWACVEEARDALSHWCPDVEPPPTTLKGRREALGLSITDLANLSHLGVLRLEAAERARSRTLDVRRLEVWLTLLESSGVKLSRLDLVDDERQRQGASWGDLGQALGITARRKRQFYDATINRLIDLWAGIPMGA